MRSPVCCSWDMEYISRELLLVIQHSVRIDYFQRRRGCTGDRGHMLDRAGVDEDSRVCIINSRYTPTPPLHVLLLCNAGIYMLYLEALLAVIDTALSVNARNVGVFTLIHKWS